MVYFNQGNGRKEGGVEGWRKDVAREGEAGSKSKEDGGKDIEGGRQWVGRYERVAEADRWLENQ